MLCIEISRTKYIFPKQWCRLEEKTIDVRTFWIVQKNEIGVFFKTNDLNQLKKNEMGRSQAMNE